MTIYTPGSTGQVTVSVTRYGQATLDRGQFTQSTTSFNITDANIQPADQSDIIRLPEGQREMDTLVIFTATPLYGVTSGRSKADRIDYNGKTYEVYSVSTYSMGVLDHTEALMVGPINA